MIEDSNLRFLNDVAVTTSKVSSVIDGQKIRNLARSGKPVLLNIYLTQVATSSANQLTILLVASSGATPGATDYAVAYGGRILVNMPESAMGAVGLIYRGALPEKILYEQLALYLLATTALDTPKLKAFLSLGSDVDGAITTASA
jgi:hypothetical protein